jgi:hypothetical protein
MTDPLSLFTRPLPSAGKLIPHHFSFPVKISSKTGVFPLVGFEAVAIFVE